MKYLLSNNKYVEKITSKYLSSNMYVLIDNAHALIVDPSDYDELNILLEENKVKNITILLTHEHPDHTCGIPLLLNNYSLYVICQKKCAELISNRRNNRPIMVSFVLSNKDKKDNSRSFQRIRNDYFDFVCYADISFDKYYTYNWFGYCLKFFHTPGHSQGSCCIILNDEILFTGDSLLYDYPVITRFPGGNQGDYNKITLPFFRKQNKKLLVLPGHGNSSMLGIILKKYSYVGF